MVLKTTNKRRGWTAVDSRVNMVGRFWHRLCGGRQTEQKEQKTNDVTEAAAGL